MIPPHISDDVKSGGERRIFDLFKHDPNTQDWIVLHSLALTEHVKRMFGEIDFVVLAPNLGIFCLEVKSGNVSMTDGVWRFTNRFGRPTEKLRGPFQQAQEGMFSLITAVKKKFGSLHRLGTLLYGYGVMFPDFTYTAHGTDQLQWQIYDRDSRRNSISQYIIQLSNHYFTRMRDRFKWFGESNLPTSSDVNNLLEFLRGDFEGVTSSYDRLITLEEHIFKYTEEQIHCLDLMQDNPRCLFEGPAGTGKTVLAIESARRSVLRDQRVLFICYNNLLGTWISYQLGDLASEEHLVITSFHNLLSRLCSISNVRKTPSGINSDKEEFFTKELPLLALKSLEHSHVELFDKVIIDEGQDLMSIEYLDVINRLVKGGLSSGNWEMYCDFERQAIYSSMSRDQMLALVNSKASFARCRLSTNCRNTRLIGEEISALTSFDNTSTQWRIEGGLPVEYYFFDNFDDEAVILGSILEKLKDEGIPLEKITILSPFKFKSSCVSRIKTQVSEIAPTNYMKNKGKITFSTIHSFKGLENAYIIITDISKLNDGYMRKLLYVGMSRAKVGLIIFASNSIKKEYLKLQVRSLGL